MNFQGFDADKIISYTQLDNEFHSYDDQPSLVMTNGYSFWHQHGKLNRNNDKPAMIFAGGDQYWYQNDELHRDNDLPAIIFSQGNRYWYRRDKKHRDNNRPASIEYIGGKLEAEWYTDGVLIRRCDDYKINVKSAYKLAC